MRTGKEIVDALCLDVSRGETRPSNHGLWDVEPAARQDNQPMAARWFYTHWGFRISDPTINGLTREAQHLD